MTGNNTNYEPIVLRPEEAAQLIGVSKPTMYALCRRKDFPAVRFGRVIRIPRSGLERWLNEQASGEGDRV